MGIKSKEIKEEFCFGCEDLMGQRLTQVTAWLPRSDFQSVIDQLEKGEISWMVTRKKTKDWDQEVWRYALFRKYIESL